jgi:hypothetical protein
VEILFQKQPVFHELLAAKQKEANDFAKEIDEEPEQVSVAFFKDTDSGDILVVLCKKRLLCPCSKPALYRVATKEEIQSPGESYRGQKDILKALGLAK